MKAQKIQEMLDNMDEFTMKRWSALVDGVQLIAIKANTMGVDGEFKTGSLNRYIDEVTEKIKVY